MESQKQMTRVNPPLKYRLQYAKSIPKKTCGSVSEKPRYGYLGRGRSGPKQKGTLRQLGFATYEDYLASDLWQRIRIEVFKLRGGFCMVCREPAQEVHHASYNKPVMQGADIKPLYPLCKKCHRDIHKGGVCLSKANKKLFKLMGVTKSKGFPAAFVEFWSAYPRKVGKRAALKAWVKACDAVAADRDIDLVDARALVLEKCILFSKSEKGQSGKFCPYPTTWLNQGRYDDDPVEWGVNPIRTIEEITEDWRP